MSSLSTIGSDDPSPTSAGEVRLLLLAPYWSGRGRPSSSGSPARCIHIPYHDLRDVDA